MTDREDKTVPDLPAVRLGGAGTRGTNSGATSNTEGASNEKEFNPFKFQSITMPPGLRAEIIEHARNRPPESAPEDTLPPNQGVTVDNVKARNDEVTLRLASDNVDTERLPRVILARARRRGLRAVTATAVALSVLVIGFLALDHRQTPPPTTPAPERRATPTVATVTATRITTASSVAPHLQMPVVSATPSGQQAPAPEARAADRTHQVASGVSRRPSRPQSASASAPKVPLSGANGVDLLDFQGPAPK